MYMALSLIDLQHLSKLANLNVTEEQLSALAPQLSEILEFVGKLEEVDVTDVVETVEITGLKNVYAKDVSVECLEPEVAIGQAPKTSKGYVLVPAIFEEGSDE